MRVAVVGEERECNQSPANVVDRVTALAHAQTGLYFTNTQRGEVVGSGGRKEDVDVLAGNGYRVRCAM